MLIPFFFLAALLQSTSGVISVTNTQPIIPTPSIAVSAGAISCTINKPSASVSVICNVPVTVAGKTVNTLHSETVSLSLGSSVIGSYSVGADSIQWIFSAQIGQQIEWSITANGTTQSGEF